MKLTAIPAQVTTVEDRIAGNLSLKQIILLASPLYIAAFIYLLIPPFVKYDIYKLMLVATISVAIGSLAIRLNQKLLLELLIIRLKYELKPSVYISSKTNRPAKEFSIVVPPKKDSLAQETKQHPANVQSINTAILMRSESLLNEPKHKVSFKMTKTGGLDVKVTSL